jgi:hypothetical protein
MPLSDPDHFYETVANYKTLTQQSALVSVLTDGQVKALLLEAMSLIDGYIGRGWEPFATDQEFIFPRSQDQDSEGTAFVPRPVTTAARLVADAVMLRRTKGISPDEVQSESHLGFSYQKKQSPIHNENGFAWFPQEAIALLEQYRRNGGVFGLDESDELLYN